TFEAQKDWYHNASSTHYFENLNGAIINSFIKQGIYKQPPPTVANVSVAAEVYKTLEELKTKADELFAKIEAAGASAQGDVIQKKVKQARSFYDAYDYLDAEKTARSAVDQLGIK